MIPIVVLGEKNHGKSTLIGRLLYETESIPKDRLSEIKSAIKKSGKRFLWAHLLDSFRYEREREMTLDTTRAVIKIGGKFYEFIDVPGHKELIKNMLTGASDAKYAILMIDAEEGLRPQTLKHLEIAKFLGIEKIIAVVNKIDKVSYSKTNFEKIKNKLSIQALPLAAETGKNLLKKYAKLKWFRGPTLQKAVEKNFKDVPVKVAENMVMKPTKNISATCIFIEKPRKKLVLESRHSRSPVSGLNGFRKINELQKLSVKLKSPTKISDKFVIKTGGRITGVCRRYSD